MNQSPMTKFQAPNFFCIFSVASVVNSGFRFLGR